MPKVLKPERTKSPLSSSTPSFNKADAKSPKKSAASFFKKSRTAKSKSGSTSLVSLQKDSKHYESLLSSDTKTKIKNILIGQQQPEGFKSPYFELEQKYKVKIHFFPFIKVVGVSGRDFRRQRITLNDYSGIIFTSRNTIDHFFRVCEELRFKISQETKFFCTSEAIALYLQKYMQYRKRKVFFGDPNNIKVFRSLLLKHKETTQFLYICAELGKDEIPLFMAANKFNFSEGIMYKTVPNDLSSVSLEEFDMMVLFSSSSVYSILNNFQNFQQNQIRIGAFGRYTADAVLEAKLKLHLMAPLDKTPSILSAIENYLKEVKK